MNLAFIAPTEHIKKAMAASDINMCLAHLCEDPLYTEAFKESSKYTILDNSFYELGRCISTDEMLIAAEKVGADCLVMEDGKTEQFMTYSLEGYEVMFIPKTLEDFKMAMRAEEISKVGISAIWAEKYLGLTRNWPFARFLFMRQGWEAGFSASKVHLLGATDSLMEIGVCKPFVSSWDSSAAVWSGLHGLDVSRQTVKFAKKVDFNSKLPWTEQVEQNIQFIKEISK